MAEWVTKKLCVVIHLLFWWRNGNVEVVVLHEGSDLSTFLSDDVAMILVWDADLATDRDQVLWREKAKLQ